MPFEMKLTQDSAHWSHWGIVSFEEIRSANSQFMDDSRSGTVTSQIIDLSDVETLLVTKQQFSIIGGFDLGQSFQTPTMRVAIIVSDNRFSDQLSGYLEALETSSWDVRVFTERYDALIWAQQR